MQAEATSKSKPSVYVGLYKAREKQEVSMKYNKKKYFLGYYENEIDAATAYDKKVVEFYGLSAQLHFPV